MLLSGLKGGNLLNNIKLNKIFSTAEQMTNINVCSHIKALSNGGGLDHNNYIWHTQKRDRLVLVAVYFSGTGLISATYPALGQALDLNGVDYTSAFVNPNYDTETFDFTRGTGSYRLTIKKTTYEVSAAGNKTLRFKFIPLTPKSWVGEKLNSMYIIQFDSIKIDIANTIDGVVALKTDFNLVKQAFRKEFSYNLKIVDANNVATNANNMIPFISTENDLTEIGVPVNKRLRYLTKQEVFSPFYAAQMIASSLTTGTLFSNEQFISSYFDLYSRLKNDATLAEFKLGMLFPYLNEFGTVAYEYRPGGMLYLTTATTENKALDSIDNDALNGYELTMLGNDYSDRLQGALFYPVIGQTLLTDDDTGGVYLFDMVIKNNLTDAFFDLSFTLTSGYKVKFAIL